MRIIAARLLLAVLSIMLILLGVGCLLVSSEILVGQTMTAIVGIIFLVQGAMLSGFQFLLDDRP